MTRYITTSIPYINAEPHIGFLFELLAGDVLARYYRQLGEEVFFLTGTDEHGIKVERAAKAASEDPQVYADRISKLFADLGEDFDVKPDFFIRTTDLRHKRLVQQMWEMLMKAGVLEKRSYSGLYCTGCEAFKTAREAAGGSCEIHNQPLEKITEQNWFFKLSSYKNAIRLWLDSGAVIPASRQKEITNVVDELEDISVSRSKEKLSWGIPVPDDPEQVMYVWTDALLNYLTALSICNKDELWPADIQIIGKDILRFHGAIWPGLLLALGLPPPKKLVVHGFVGFNGQKMSKSLGNIVTPRELLERYGSSDAVRYLLFRQLSFLGDGDFVWSDFDSLYTGELANGLGNLVGRVIGLRERAGLGPTKINRETLLNEQKKRIEPQLKGGVVDFQAELTHVNMLIRQADQQISESKLWEDPTQPKKITVLEGVSHSLAEIALRLEPYTPTASSTIVRRLSDLSGGGVLFERLDFAKNSSADR